jgi:hypothetical protein
MARKKKSRKGGGGCSFIRVLVLGVVLVFGGLVLFSHWTLVSDSYSPSSNEGHGHVRAGAGSPKVDRALSAKQTVETLRVNDEARNVAETGALLGQLSELSEPDKTQESHAQARGGEARLKAELEEEQSKKLAASNQAAEESAKLERVRQKIALDKKAMEEEASRTAERAKVAHAKKAAAAAAEKKQQQPQGSVGGGGGGAITPDAEYVEYADKGWCAAHAYCISKGKQLCSNKDLCPEGIRKPPRHGIQKLDRFTPTRDSANTWLYVGDTFRY